MKILSYITSHKILSGCVVALCVALGWFFFGRGGTAITYDTEIAVVRDVIEEVDVTGTVTPVHDVSLAFETSGRVGGVNVRVGDTVYVGKTLAYLSSADLYAQRAGSAARRDAAAADLAELLSGTRAEDLAVYEAKIVQAEASLSNAKKAVVNSVQDAFTRADNAVRNNADQLFTNADTSNPNLIIPVYSSTLESDIEWRRFLIGETLEVLQDIIDSDDDTVALSISSVSGYLEDVRTFLQKVALAVNELQASSLLSQTTIDGYKADVATARTNVNTAISGLISAKDGYTAAEQNRIIAERQRDAAAASATPEQITAAEAALAAAQADLDGYDARIAEQIISAPVAGTVTYLDIDTGEIATAGKEVLRVISTGAYDIEAYIPEADIASVKRNDTATFTLDAYDDDVELTATVVMIDPAETVIEGVSTYKVIMHFEDSEEMVRSGMTANVTIITDTRKNVIAIPARAVNTADDGSKFVQVMKNDGTPEDRVVTTGLRGSDGYIEITSGLSEGEEVVVFVRE
jgi:RND family efflux transporter MFP subunit